MTSSPAISKEIVDLKIYSDKDFKITVHVNETKDDQFYQSELVPGNDYSEAQYFEFTPGKYKAVDQHGEVMLEQDIDNFDLAKIIDVIKASPDLRTVQNLVGGGMLLQAEFFTQNQEPTGRIASPDNPYMQDPNYKVYRNYLTSDHGALMIQDAVILLENNTLELMALFDSDYNLISKTSFRYEGEGEELTLKNTQEVSVDYTEEGEQITYLHLAEYDDFQMTLNL
mgnify:CR=1 FL=1